jgi:glycosyltransferase involved in cell wall biosynthesis
LKILFVYDHFYPAYRAGGPIQSLLNLSIALQPDCEISVLTSAYDHNVTEVLTGIEMDTWTRIKLPGTEKIIKIWYANRKKIKRETIAACIAAIQPGVIYINGLFSFRFVVIPLLTIDKSTIKIVLCPRGMLQSGALAGKAFKKKWYLTALKISGLVKKITWHATNVEEEEDIKKVFGPQTKIIVAGNIPKRPVSNMEYPKKMPGQLRLIYLSLIAEKKNLLQVIELVNKSASNITLDIYGPVKDAAYWKKCEQAIGNGNVKIKYKGDLKPEMVQDTFIRYDASILLTKGENFGHALYESLSSGRPIITSFFTPWNELEQKKAGWNLDISNAADSLVKLTLIAEMNQVSFDHYCQGAYKTAKSYYNESSDLRNYYKLFE